jgi:hypothetical protein
MSRTRHASARPGIEPCANPVGYKHSEDDARPFEVKADIFPRLDWAIEAFMRDGVHARRRSCATAFMRDGVQSLTCTRCPGSQNALAL